MGPLRLTWGKKVMNNGALPMVRAILGEAPPYPKFDGTYSPWIPIGQLTTEMISSNEPLALVCGSAESDILEPKERGSGALVTTTSTVSGSKRKHKAY
ncbi:hypothetical protein N7468_008928 [Penicillium chermesinum]|uniref:Uncharacterized protein n=1 Tax=Penicillium chermesinum TaxID=63820 RepID=A0A9W9TES4_9EURO|nr:uncharacterized protein N7468_008928 [Penicillium chermesinum]KAJ5219724.1 hypothetical protein N7468_008928 [Penicillium chermesinum]